jgi:hypothetical protein
LKSSKNRFTFVKDNSETEEFGIMMIGILAEGRICFLGAFSIADRVEVGLFLCCANATAFSLNCSNDYLSFSCCVPVVCDMPTLPPEQDTIEFRSISTLPLASF